MWAVGREEMQVRDKPDAVRALGRRKHLPTGKDPDVGKD